MQMQMKKVIHHFILGPDLATIAVEKKAKSASLPPRTHTRTRTFKLTLTHTHFPSTEYIPVSADGVEIAAGGVTYANMLRCKYGVIW